MRMKIAWLVVEQGRQWQDEDGRHVLVMHPGGQVDELLLSARTLRWELVPRRPNSQIIKLGIDAK